MRALRPVLRCWRSCSASSQARVPSKRSTISRSENECSCRESRAVWLARPRRRFRGRWRASATARSWNQAGGGARKVWRRAATGGAPRGGKVTAGAFAAPEARLGGKPNRVRVAKGRGRGVCSATGGAAGTAWRLRLTKNRPPCAGTPPCGPLGHPACGAVGRGARAAARCRPGAAEWAATPGWDVIGIGRDTAPGLPALEKSCRGFGSSATKPHRPVGKGQHHYLRRMEDAVLHG